MTLIVRNQSQKQSYYQVDSPEADEFVTCTQTALKAYSQGLVNHYYFDNGRKQIVESPNDITR